MLYKGELTIYRTNLTTNVTLGNLPIMVKSNWTLLPTNMASVRSAVRMIWLPSMIPDSWAMEANLKWFWGLFREYWKLPENSSEVFFPWRFPEQVLQTLSNLCGNRLDCVLFWIWTVRTHWDLKELLTSS